MDGIDCCFCQLVVTVIDCYTSVTYTFFLHTCEQSKPILQNLLQVKSTVGLINVYKVSNRETRHQIYAAKTYEKLAQYKLYTSV